MEPENLADWIEDSYYIPVRRAALPLLEDFYAEDPNRAAALAQLEVAVPRPRVPQFNAWRGLLDDAWNARCAATRAPRRAGRGAAPRAGGALMRLGFSPSPR
jgi:sn-glycerol 3-phosphate transport system substrate-binding protein